MCPHCSLSYSDLLALPFQVRCCAFPGKLHRDSGTLSSLFPHAFLSTPERDVFCAMLFLFVHMLFTYFPQWKGFLEDKGYVYIILNAQFLNSSWNILDS